ncbi:metallophosphoesterase [Peribacillus sp. NPDC097284]|uniref:metallophosphoesterase n=1 Tax=Peribacillus sp. NPDC097284 TaxID=3364401 RepID=UPI0037F8EF5E
MKNGSVQKISFFLVIFSLVFISAFLLLGNAKATVLLEMVEDPKGGSEVDASSKSENKELDLTVLYTNDTHAHLKDIPRRFTAINKIRNVKENVLLLDAGDVFTGSLYFKQYLGQADIQFMNKIGYDAMVLGNHEFDKSSVILRDFIKAAEFPIVGANIDFSKDEELKDLSRIEIDTTGWKGTIHPSVVKKIKGQRVGIIGLTTQRTTLLSNPNKDIVFEDAFKKAKETINALEAKGVNKIIVLSHLGYSNDKKLANTVDGIDVIVGSHSHHKLKEPDVINQKKKPTLIVQAGRYGRFLGQLDVTFDDKGKLTMWNGKLLDITDKNEKGEFIYKEDKWAKYFLEELSVPIKEIKKKKRVHEK